MLAYNNFVEKKTKLFMPRIQALYYLNIKFRKNPGGDLICFSQSDKNILDKHISINHCV